MKKIVILLASFISASILSQQQGNVGVNTTTPQKTLHVNGSLQVTNELNVGGDDKTAGNAGRLGQILTSNGESKAPQWKSVSVGSEIGDLKYSFLTNDHNGWIKLDGREINSLTPGQQENAKLLGFNDNIPNATDSYFVQNADSPGSISGSNMRTISQNQLPNTTLSITGNTNTAGNHSHSYTDHGNTTYEVTRTGSNDLTPIADDTEGSYNTGYAGNHSHTVSGKTSSINGGVDQKTLDIRPQSLSANAFVYLGD